jgi:hypothetical protein
MPSMSRGTFSPNLKVSAAFRARTVARDVLVLEPATGALTPASGWRRWFLS